MGRRKSSPLPVPALIRVKHVIHKELVEPFETIFGEINGFNNVQYDFASKTLHEKDWKSELIIEKKNNKDGGKVTSDISETQISSGISSLSSSSETSTDKCGGSLGRTDCLQEEMIELNIKPEAYDPVFDTVKFAKFSGNLKYPLVQSILQIILDFPFGLTPTYLSEEFERRHGYVMDLSSLGFTTFEELLRTNHHVFNLKDSKLMDTTLVFPVSRKLYNIDDVQRKICHYVSCMMRLVDGPLRVNEATTVLRNIFGVNLNVEAWGFHSQLEYFKILLETWGNGSIEIVESNLFSDDNDLLGHVIQLTEVKEPPVEDDALDQFAVQPEISIEDLQVKSLTFSDFVLDDRPLPLAADCLQVGCVYIGHVELMVTPDFFFITPKGYKEKRDVFIEDMTDKYDRWTKADMHGILCMSSEHAKPNHYVAVLIEKEWTRGRILQKKEEFYKVQAFDMGDCLRRVKLSDMKYLLKEFMYAPEFSVRCRLQEEVIQKVLIRNAYSDRSYPPAFLENSFYKMLTRRPLMFMPMKRDEKDGLWEVYLMHQINDGHIIQYNLGADIMNSLGCLDCVRRIQ